MSWEDEVRAEAAKFAGVQSITCPRCSGLAAKGFIAGAQRARPKWISVDEKLPEVYHDVATQCADNAGSFYDIDCWCGERWDSGHDVTHWCELPELDHD